MKRTRQPSAKRRQSFLPLAIGTTGGVALATIAFWFFQEQAENVVRGSADRYDEMIMKAVHTIDDPRVNQVMEAITQLGTHAAISTAAGLTAIGMFRQ
ncbi:MAG: hypothetical protein ABI837_10755, partial [Acidobacteriota bacterium]